MMTLLHQTGGVFFFFPLQDRGEEEEEEEEEKMTEFEKYFDSMYVCIYLLYVEYVQN